MSKVLIIGDSCVDEYIYCTTNRFCPDAPVPVLKPESYVCTEGMAGNVADNLRALGVDVELISNANQIKKTRYVDERTNHMFIRIDEGEDDIFPVAKKTLDGIDWNQYDAVIISDYCKGFLTEDEIAYISNQHINTFLDTKKSIGNWASNINFIKINEVESNQNKTFLENNDSFYDKVISTLGSKGARYKGELFPVDKVDVRDTSGAGDTFMAGLVYAYITHIYGSFDEQIHTAIKFANKCSTQVVQKKGTAKVNLKQLKYEV